MKTKKQILFEYIVYYSQQFKVKEEQNPRIETSFLSEQLNMQRSNVSSLLNQLVKEGKMKKHSGRPVLYSLIEDEEVHMDESYFLHLIGYDRSLKEPIRITKAAIHYPAETLSILVSAEKGCGSKTLARCTYQYACSIGVLNRSAPFHIIDCSMYDDSSFLDAFLQTTSMNHHNNVKSFILLSNLSSISKLTMMKVLNATKASHNQHILMLQTNESVLCKFLKEHTDFQIQLPLLEQRTPLERFQFIESFFQVEAGKLKKQIYVNYGLMQSLMLCPIKDNMDGLKRILQYGIANALARSRKAKELKLEFSDFSDDVRKGLLYVNKADEEFQKLFQKHDDYIFTAEQTYRLNGNEETMDIYHRVDKMKQIVCKSANSLESDHFMFHNIETELFDYLMMLNKGITEEKFNSIVSTKLAEMGKEFVQRASRKFNQIYPKEIYYGICLHLNNILVQENHKQRISNRLIMEIIEKYDEEYFFVKKFIKTIESQFHVKLSLDETVFITLFLKLSLQKCTKKEVVTLIAMHGEAVASSLAQSVKLLMPVRNVYAFDMPIHQNIEEAYEQLKQTLVEINQGKGIIVIYDMGSLKIMVDQIREETKLNIRTIEMPISLMALSAAKSSEEGKELDDIYQHLLNEYCDTPYASKRRKNRLVIALSSVKEQKANEIKSELNRLKDSDQYEIIGFDLDDKNLLLFKINELNYRGEVVGIVGTYNPEIFNLTFIDRYYISETKSMEELFYKKNENFDLFEYLHQQYEDIAREDLEITLIPFITKLESLFQTKIKEDNRIGLFIHMTGYIDKKLKGNRPIANFNVSDIILHQKDKLQLMKEALIPIERYFSISISDGDAATILRILFQY